MRYLRLWWMCLSRSLARDMAFRAHFIMRFCSDAVFLVVYYVFFSVLFTKVHSVAGWTKYELLLLVGTFHVINSLFLSLFFPNLLALPQHIRQGTLDAMILRPVDTQLVASVQDADLGSLANAALGGALVVHSALRLHLALTAGRVATYLLLVAVGTGMLYCLFFIVVATSFWLSEATWFFDLYATGNSFCDKPAAIYRGLAARVLMYLVPLAVVANAPAAVLVRRFTPELGVLALGGLFTLSLAARILWGKGLRHYEGASG